MKMLILMGSPRKNGNTARLLAPFTEEAKALGAELETLWLDGMDRACILWNSVILRF